MIGKRLVVLSERYEEEKASIFTLNLHTLRWQRLKGQKRSPRTHKLTPYDPPSRGGSAAAFNGSDLIVSAGHSRRAEGGPDPGPHLWRVSLPLALDWDRERLLWLACYKGDRGECGLARCPPHVIYKILGYVNGQRFYVK